LAPVAPARHASSGNRRNTRGFARLAVYLRLLSAPASADRREEVLQALAKAARVKQDLAT
jgi:hypothetical protein